ncbi:FkbM family methyltransferase [Marmoricola sp. RAF53]|uniref:FkbM family methyltransferase n=1 Tax=Marmoricola sp. RAF53 TaxID=3233059 RepID=UPI003F98126D
MSVLRNRAMQLLADRGFEIRRHSGTRRQRMFEGHGVDLVLDVGAADGGYGRLIRGFGYTGRIVSFEPLSAAYQRLSADIAGDPRWEARNVALGEESGEAQINIASNSDSSSLLPMGEGHLGAAPQVTYTGSETIRVERLDDHFDEITAGARGVYLKIDTQGFERQVLRGAAKSLPRIAGLQLELSLVPLYDGGGLIDEMISWAYGEGFRLVGMEQGWAAPDGAILQMDGVFFRPEAVSR